MPPLEDTTPWHRPRSRPLVLGHRGARHAAPENTFRAFELALAEGADGIELDVRLNADGEVIVCHDADLKRVTGGLDARKVAELSSSQCDRVQLEAGDRLPRLREVLQWAEGCQALVNVELKSDSPLSSVRGGRFALPRAVARDILARKSVLPWLWLSSFDASFLWALGWLLPEARRGLLTANPYTTLGWLPKLLCAGPLSRAPIALHPEHGLIDAGAMARWHERGLSVHTWTVNQPRRAAQLGALGANAIISDCPGKLLTRLTEPADAG